MTIDEALSELNPCPFCGGTDFSLDEKYYNSGRTYTLLYATLRHWCPKVDGTEIRIGVQSPTLDALVTEWNSKTGTK